MTADVWDDRWERRSEEARNVPERRKARWLYIAIRTMIETGELRHGEQLPSQDTLDKRYKMGATTSRSAYGRLDMLGRVSTRQGDLRRVYMPVEQGHRLLVRRQESADQQDWVGEQRRVAAAPMLPAVQFVPADGAGPVTTRWEDGTFTVPEWEAPSLGFDNGAELLTRACIVSVDGERVLASISLVPPDVLGPAVQWSDAEIGELALAGVSTVFDSTDVRSRIPTLVEEQMLGMDAVAPVFAVYRPCRINAAGGVQQWPACVRVIARADRVSTPPAN